MAPASRAVARYPVRWGVGDLAVPPGTRIRGSNVGAEWANREVVVDQGLVTSRSPDEIPAFNRGMIELFSRAREQVRPTA